MDAAPRFNSGGPSKRRYSSLPGRTSPYPPRSGLIALIATPVIRVVASVITFAHEKDWRFAAVSLIVLGVVAASLFLGK